MIFINKEFERRDLEFTDDEISRFQTVSEEIWESVSSIYSANGLDKSEYIRYLEYKNKEQKVFEDIYINSRETAVTNEEIINYLSDKLCRVSFFRILKNNGDGTLISSENVEKLRNLARYAVSKIENEGNMIWVANELIPIAAKFLSGDENLFGGEDFVSTGFLSYSNNNISQELKNAFFKREIGITFSYEDNDGCYICLKLPLFENEDDYKDMKNNVIRALKNEEFEKYINDGCDNMVVEYNNAAIEFYSPEKIEINY